MPHTEKVVFSTSEKYANIARTELLGSVPDSKFREWLERGVGLLEIPAMEFTRFSRTISQENCMFVRHVMPAHLECALGSVDDAVAQLRCKIQPLLSFFIAGRRVSVQVLTSAATTLRYPKFEICQDIGGMLLERGCVIDVKIPQQVLSIFIHKNVAFVGVSSVVDNLSAWAGGRFRLSRSDDQISRAEFKLLEAISSFNLKLPTNGLGLDLGASPGGWTRVLLGHKMRVVAVDPADIDVRLRNHPRVTHAREMAQSYFARSKKKFDIIVNDMRMDVRESCDVMLQAAPCLKSEGVVVVTFKLPEKNALRVAQNGIERLSGRYSIEHVRHLFHNRNELTVVATLN